MKKLLTLALALMLCASLAAPALAAEGANNGQIFAEKNIELEMSAALVTVAPAPGFADVPASHNFFDAIAYCAGEGIVGGYSDGTFQPSKTVTRSNFTVMLSRAFYAEYVTKYSRPEYISNGTFWANYQAMVANQALNGTSFENGIESTSVMNMGISRYDMAQLITNIMNRQGFAASESEKNAALSQISDYNDIPSQYRDAVLNVYALGIIGGYANGTFGGAVTMNRGQAAVVIYRMMQYSGSTGATGTTVTPSTPQAPVTPAVKTLTNGKAVTVANVQAMLSELQAKYPEGTSFVSGYSAGSNSTDARTVIRSYINNKSGLYNTSTTAGCGGWAALVSDYIFGQTGFPARKVALADARPGDIGISLNANGKLTHVFIVTSYARHENDTELTRVNITDANTNGPNNTYMISWGNTATQWDELMPGDWTIDIWTRYPA